MATVVLSEDENETLEALKGLDKFKEIDCITATLAISGYDVMVAGDFNDESEEFEEEEEEGGEEEEDDSPLDED